ncbi:MAG TPA: DUF808 family protein, partial [Acetobacteraceae bacterium]|nr:DUF808 family protein [Acetobacteraceae bacterium]
IATQSLLMQGVVLAVVGIAITVVVYGAVALIVKADDAGLAMAGSGSGATRALGRALVVGMPPFLKALSILGTAAMLWVGGGIILHGIAEFGLGWPEHAIAALAAAIAAALSFAQAAIAWIIVAILSGLVGLAIGAALIPVAEHVIAPLLRRRAAH